MEKRKEMNYHEEEEDSAFFEKPYEKPKEETKVEVKQVSRTEGKKQYKVYRIIGNRLLLTDMEGNSVGVPLTDEFKNVKAGELIYI